MKLKLILFLTFSSALCLQARNYDQELFDLLSGKRIKEVQSFYTEYRDSILHPFTNDSYRLVSNIYDGKPDSVFSQLPVYMNNYYGSIMQDDLLFFLPTF
jgi:hypothetical protein